MGTFGGHAIPGTIFVIVSVWHIISIYKRYYRCKRENSKQLSSLWYPFSCLCGRAESWPIEPVIKLTFITIALALEIYTGSKNYVFYMVGNKQHVTMYFFFGFASLIDILVYFKANLPAHLDYAMIFIANGVEFILFRFHLHGRSSLDVLLHTLLLYTLAAIAVSFILEMRYRNSLLIALTSRFLLLLQGTWFWQIGFVLYKPMFGEKWDEEDHDQMMLIPTYFGVHIGVNIILILLIGSVISCWSNKRRRQDPDDVYSMKRLIDTNSNAQTVIDLNDDSEEEDVDFQKAY